MNNLPTALSVIATLLIAGPLAAQVGGPDCPHASKHAASPYAGEQNRAVKALSDEETAKLLAGHGMGLARAAELNHYPGPKHVLELADALQLSAEQIESTRAIFDSMKKRATDLGKKILEAEIELDRQFAARSIDDASLARMVLAIGELQGALRLAHLEAHLEMRGLMSPEQIRRYDTLRGYGEAASEKS